MPELTIEWHGSDDCRIDKTVSRTELNVSYSVHCTGIKCDGPAGEWVIDGEGQLEGYGGVGRIAATTTAQIEEGSLSGEMAGTVTFTVVSGGSQSRTEGNYRGTASFDEDGPRLELTVTSGSGNGCVCD